MCGRHYYSRWHFHNPLLYITYIYANTHTHNTHTHTQQRNWTRDLIQSTTMTKQKGLHIYIYIYINPHPPTHTHTYIYSKYIVKCHLLLWSKLNFQHHYSSLQSHMIFRNLLLKKYFLLPFLIIYHFYYHTINIFVKTIIHFIRIL